MNAVGNFLGNTHVQIVVGLFLLLIFVQWWKLGKLNAFWKATIS